MHFLGIDYGQVYLGLAIIREEIPTPLFVIKSKSEDHKIREILNICEKENIEKIIIGKAGYRPVPGKVSGKIENRIIGFTNKLKKMTSIEIIQVDETLTSNEAVDYMIREGVPQKKRKEMEHAYAAALLLKLYQQEFI